jgi:hypothetical protein
VPKVPGIVFLPIDTFFGLYYSGLQNQTDAVMKLFYLKAAAAAGTIAPAVEDG